MLWVLRMLALYFLLMAPWNLFRDQGEVAGYSLLLAMGFSGCEAFLRGRKESREFVAWLLKNRERLANEPMLYKHQRLSLDTQLTQFELCISCLVLTAKSPSPYLVTAHPSTRWIGALYSIVTFTCGWWGIPFGPLYTIQILAKNLRGGEQQTVAQLLDGVTEKDGHIHLSA